MAGYRTGTAAPFGTVSVAAALFLGTVAFMITGIQPVLLGALAGEGRLSEAMLGRVAWAEIVAIAAASAFGPALLRWLRPGSGRRAITFACFLLAVVNAAVYVSHDPNLLISSRLVAGLIEGLLLATTNLAITRAVHPERLSALFLMVSAIPQVAAAYLLPSIVMPRFGADSGFALLVALSCAGIGAGLLLGNEIQDPAPSPQGRARVWTLPVLLGLLGIVLQNAGNGAAWEYQARAGEILHFSGTTVGIAVAADLIFQIVGTLIVAWVAWRLPFRSVLIASCFVQAAVLIALSRVHTPAMYVAVCAAFGMLWLGVNPFQVSLIVDLDKTRQAALLVAALQLLGFGSGPLVCSFLVRPGDVSAAFLGGAAMILAGFVLYTLAIVLARGADQRQ